MTAAAPAPRTTGAGERPRLVLAYSGGLDTSVAIRWLAEHKGYDVVACAIDVGQAQPGELDRVRQRALDCGAVESFVVKLVTPNLKATNRAMERYLADQKSDAP